MVMAQCLCSLGTVSIVFASRRRICIRACAAAESPPAEVEDSAAAFEASGSAPAATSPTSLVSRTPQLVGPAEGTAGILKVNHYSVLRVPIGASRAQISQAFKERCEEVMKSEDEEASKAELRALQTSFDILTTDEERRVYDWALQRFENRDGTYIWPFETDITQKQKYNDKDDAPVMRSFDEEGNKKLATFLLGWVAISVLFSTTMNTWIPYNFNP